MLRTRQQFGKYVIERRLAEGGFASVYQARDTLEGIRVALKIPRAAVWTEEVAEYFRHEVRLVARLEHPNILSLKYADYIEGQLVLVTALGESTLAERLQRRLSLSTAVDFTAQMLAGVSYAHQQRIIHCDIKPDNFLIFPEYRLKLADFGIAKVVRRTLRGSGTGTVGYLAPEQALGKPSFRSDVFSLGIVLFRMFSGVLPEWPYQWPLPGTRRLQQRLAPEFIELIRRAIQLDPKLRFRDALAMQGAFRRIKTPLLPRDAASLPATGRPRARKTRGSNSDWRQVRFRNFQRQFGRQLETRAACPQCQGPLSEAMQACPWCQATRKLPADETRFPQQCPRCLRGLKLDWAYCPWCYGEGFEANRRTYSDKRYVAHCQRCRGRLMKFMKYCPWCHCRVRQAWKIDESPDRCQHCHWGVVTSYWDYCPWCTKRITG